MRSRWFYAVLILLGVLILFSWQAGNFLVLEDEPEKTPVGVVLMGKFPSRILHAVDLYHQGWIDRIVAVESVRGEGYEILLEKGISVPGEADNCVAVAEKLGVETEDIILIPGGADSTACEARIVADYFEDDLPQTITVITSPSHSRRAASIFSLLLDVSVISSPTPYEEFSGGRWWGERHWAREVVLEYQKMIYFFLYERFRL